MMSDQLKRARSPNYPAISLPEALSQLRLLFDRIHRHAAPKEAVIKGLGYGGWNGTSATALSAQGKYGLLDRLDGDQFKISDLGMRLMFHETPKEYADALHEAARRPPLFSELLAEYPGPLPYEDILRPRLIRRGFSMGAINTVIEAYRDTMEFVSGNSVGYPAEDQQLVEQAIQSAETSQPVRPPAFVASPSANVQSQNPGAWLEEQISDDEGNRIIMKFTVEPTVETYEFLKDYLDFRVQRMRKTLAAKMVE